MVSNFNNSLSRFPRKENGELDVEMLIEQTSNEFYQAILSDNTYIEGEKLEPKFEVYSLTDAFNNLHIWTKNAGVLVLKKYYFNTENKTFYRINGFNGQDAAVYLEIFSTEGEKIVESMRNTLKYKKKN